MKESKWLCNAQWPCKVLGVGECRNASTLTLLVWLKKKKSLLQVWWWQFKDVDLRMLIFTSDAVSQVLPVFRYQDNDNRRCNCGDTSILFWAVLSQEEASKRSQGRRDGSMSWLFPRDVNSGSIVIGVRQYSQLFRVHVNVLSEISSSSEVLCRKAS